MKSKGRYYLLRAKHIFALQVLGFILLRVNRTLVYCYVVHFTSHMQKCIKLVKKNIAQITKCDC